MEMNQKKEYPRISQMKHELGQRRELGVRVRKKTHTWNSFGRVLGYGVVGPEVLDMGGNEKNINERVREMRLCGIDAQPRARSRRAIS